MVSCVFYCMPQHYFFNYYHYFIQEMCIKQVAHRITCILDLALILRKFGDPCFRG